MKTQPQKGDFQPHNPLEEQLRRLLTDKNTPYWDFYTPLAASPLWIVVPEKAAAAALHSKESNPGVPVWCGPGADGETVRCVGIYSSELRAQKGVEMHSERMPEKMTCVSAKGYGLLRYMMTFDADILLNMGQKECQYQLDPDMIDILLERPEPPDPEPPRTVSMPSGDPAKFLTPVRELLARDGSVRAAWIFEAKSGRPELKGQCDYELALLMQNPEDDHLRQQVETMARALTPVQMEWAVTLLRGEDAAFRQLSERHPPFYTAKGFLEE
jgi:hypothetical protein